MILREHMRRSRDPVIPRPQATSDDFASAARRARLRWAARTVLPKRRNLWLQTRVGSDEGARCANRFRHAYRVAGFA